MRAAKGLLHRSGKGFVVCSLAVAFFVMQVGAIHLRLVAHELPDFSREVVEELVRELMDRQGAPSISVAVARDNQLVYARGFGFADMEHKVQATEQTLYRTASIAKPLTASLVLSLSEDGKLDLDSSVRHYVPEFPEKRWPVTSRQLLGHLGGVRHYKSTRETTSTEHFFSVEDALDTFAADALIHEPGTKYRYSTFGYNLLGNVAERAGADDYLTLLKEQVLTPAGMSATVVDDTFAIVPNRARGYIRATPRLLMNLPKSHGLVDGELYNAALHDTSMKVPAGGLLSTPADLVRFAVAMNKGQLLKAGTRDQMWSKQKTASGKQTSYGLGWNLGVKSGQRAVWHTGSQSGTSTVLLLYPETGTAVAIMSNLQRLSLLSTAVAIAERIAAPVHDYSAAEEKLNAAIRYEMELKQLPAFSISLVDDSGVVSSNGFGFQDAAKEIPANGKTVYRVGSVSKLFTDIAVLQRVEQGQLDLDAPIQRYLPDFRPNNPFGVTQTLRQMMAHRSGLVRESPVGNYFDPTEPSLKETVASLNHTSLACAPNSKTKYSNAAIAVVGAVLEKSIEDSHPAQVRKSILSPLRMNQSSFTISPSIRDQLATGWMWTLDGRRFEAPTFLLGTGPAGNLYASMEDLAKFISCILNNGETRDGPLLNSHSLDLMSTPIKDEHGIPQSFGLGFHIRELDGHKMIGHGGAVYGFSTQLEILPEEKLGVAASCALDGSNGVVGRLAKYALRLMLAVQSGEELPAYKVTAPLPKSRVQRLLGTYREVGANRFVRICEYNGQVLMHRGSSRHILRALSEDGTVVIDDVNGFGGQVELQGDNSLGVGGVTYERIPEEPPADIPARWRGLIGEYGWDHNTLYILEENGQLYALIEWFYYYPLTEVGDGVFEFPNYGLYHDEGLQFTVGDDGVATEVNAAEVVFKRREVGTKDGETFRIEPIKPIDQLRESALAATPPAEPGDFRKAALVELVELEPAIDLDIRYASTNNFTGALFYKQARAFMQRPAAEAVVRAHRRLSQRGLGLLIHDAYRPWHVTKMFWDATPNSLKDFVANPANGSRHNRGCAVDLTLYDLATGDPIQMVAGYDEFSPRSFPLYPGGTSRQRWYRQLLRETMESEGFSIYEYEWWHFDYKDWQQYRIGNDTFEQLLK